MIMIMMICNKKIKFIHIQRSLIICDILLLMLNVKMCIMIEYEYRNIDDTTLIVSSLKEILKQHIMIHIIQISMYVTG